MNARRFTLVELLTVIVIIMILIGILMPTISIVIRKAEENQTKTRIKTLVTAIKQYESQYGVLPNAGTADSNTSGDSTTGDLTAASGNNNYDTVISLLTNIGSPGNTRGIRFLEPTDQTTGKFLDAWQQEFTIKFDSNYNGTIDGENVNGVGNGFTVYSSAVVLSKGPDEGWNSSTNNSLNEDNIYSWDN